jgi:hypothetical protein
MLPIDSDSTNTPEIRVLPNVEPRVESGPVVFGHDWPGTFIRGDNAIHYALHLRTLLQDKTPVSPALDGISRAVLSGLLSDLESSCLVKRNG